MLEESKKNKILLVDDTPSEIGMVRTALEDQGYDVFVATTGKKAVKRAQLMAPDLILLDIMMPGMDGYATCKQLKAQNKTRDIAVIFMSALTETFDKVKGFKLGAVDYITKPIKIEELLSRVNTHLTLGRLQKELKKVNAELEERVSVRTAELNKSNLQLKKEISERKQAENELQEKEKKLQQQAQHLEEVNTALKVLLEHMKEENKEFQKRILANMEKLIFPYLEKMDSGSLSAKKVKYLRIIKANLKDIISPFAATLSSQYSGFTPTEIQVADLIKQGKSSKEIASLMDVEISSVSFHRNNIRHKLGLVNKKMNLRSHLMSISTPPGI